MKNVVLSHYLVHIDISNIIVTFFRLEYIMESKMAVRACKYYKHFPNTSKLLNHLYISDFNAPLNTLNLRNTNEKRTRTPLYSWRSHRLSGQYSLYCGLLLLRTNLSLLKL